MLVDTSKQLDQPRQYEQICTVPPYPPPPHVQLVAGFLKAHAGEDAATGELMYQKLLEHLRRLRVKYTKQNPDARQRGGRPKAGQGMPTYSELLGI